MECCEYKKLDEDNSQRHVNSVKKDNTIFKSVNSNLFLYVFV